jgi:isocitrate lyase
MLQDITIRKQAICTNLAFWRLASDTHFAMHCHECRLERKYGEEF